MKNPMDEILQDAPECSMEFTLLNRMGVSIAEIYAVSMTDSDWGVDYLEDEKALEDGEDREILLDAQQCWRYWKLKLVDEAGEESIWEAIDIAQVSEVMVYYDDEGDLCVDFA